MDKIAIRDQYNQIMGYMIDYGTYQEVRDRHGELVGRIINGQTRDRYGSLVSWQENPGLLFGGL